MHSTSEPLHDGMVDASHLISYTRADKSSPLCTIKIKPQEQSRHLLGEYAQGARLRGFSAEVAPDPDPANSLVTQITNIVMGGKHRLFLQIANYGSKAVTAVVRQL